MTAVVSEIISREAPLQTPFYPRPRLSVDRTQAEYGWWSKLRRGKQAGYELGGLYFPAIIKIMSGWALGQPPTVVTGNDSLDEQANEFMTREFQTVRAWYEDALALGDSYLVVNPDGTLSEPPADTVDVVTNELDYRQVDAVRITTRLETAQITDEYRPDQRALTIKRMGPGMIVRNGGAVFTVSGRMEETSVEYPNPLGVIPIARYHHGREANETHGHSVGESLVSLWQRYDDLIQKSLDGVEVMGRPVPYVTTPNPDQARQLNKTRDEQWTDSAGNTQTSPVTDWADLTMLWLDKDSEFSFAQPGSFSDDTRMMSKRLFQIMLEYIGIPEWAWGGAIASSKASVDAQTPAFLRIIEGWRADFEASLIELVKLYLASVRLFTFSDRAEDVTIEWPEVLPKDETLMLAKIQYADQQAGLITRETSLRLLDLVDDPAKEVEDAKAENDAETQQYEQAVNDLMKNAPNQQEPAA